MLVGLCLMASGAAAADREVRLRVSADVVRDVPAFPRIVDPADAAERRINEALDGLDASVGKAARACGAAADGRAAWQRMFGVPMTGPGFLSFNLIDDPRCGRATPNYRVFAVTYDLRSGNPVDWTTLLPPGLTGVIRSSTARDGATLVTLSSARLHRLYLDGYRPRVRGARADRDDEECRQVVARTRNGRPSPMVVWLRGGDGLAVQFDLEHAVHTCAEDVTIPVATLRAEGASADLVRAHEAAAPGRGR